MATLPLLRVSPFPKERFLKFLSRLRIQTKDFGMVPIELLGTQTYVLDCMCEALERGVTTFYILKARQLGMTTFFIALDLFWAMEYPGLLGSFVTHTDQAKANFRNMIKIFFAHLPRTHKIKWEQENRDMIVLQNGSLLQYLVAGTKEKTKGGLGRSSANNFIHATEVAFWGSPDDLNELSATMSTHYPHRLKVEETTANGYNFWQERWSDAEEDPTICRIFVGWWRHDHYRYTEDHPWFLTYMPKGKDTPLTKLERKRVNEVKKRYGFDIKPDQIAWYRWKLESDVQDQTKMDEMFPWLEEDAFVATGAQFFLAQQITESMRASAKTPFLPFQYEMGDHWKDTRVVAVRDKRATLKVWEEADAKGYYVIGCDPAYGSGPEADSTVINVSRCYADRLVQVAEFVSPLISTYQCAWALCHLAGYYKNADYNLEITGPGEAVKNEIDKLRRDTAQMYDRMPDGTVNYDLRNVLTFMRVYLYSRIDSINRAPTAIHWKTSAANKFAIMASLKDAFELHVYDIKSMFLLNEMKTIVVNGGSVEAEAGKKDDRVMAAALAFETWRKSVRPKLEAIGLTYKSVQEEKEGKGPSLAQKLAINYLARQGIVLPRHLQ